MMQLMPATANEVAGKLGLSYNRDLLTTDTNYNMTLGSTYFQQMLRYYGGSYPLAVAAYNAGPGNVRSEEHTSELQSLMRISYAGFCLKKKNSKKKKHEHHK